MKDYLNFSAVELAMDDDFVRWVEAGHMDEELENKWNTWLIQYPEKIDVVSEAKSIVRAVINDKQYFLPDSKYQEIWARIEASVSQTKKDTSISRTVWYSIAASIALFFLFGVAIYQFKNKSWGGDQLIQHKNEGNQICSIVLEDGSIIKLQPHSAIQYPEKFSDAKREVYLSGEAFFEVARDPEKPFSVYANEIVTQVLGTSFTVRAFDKEKDIVVAVKTGKVSVFKKIEKQEKKDSSQKQDRIGTLLTPNQQVVFSREQERMIKSLVKEPIPLANSNEGFSFMDTPIAEIFKRIGNTYGVEIIFDEEALSDCSLTASLENVAFYDKLRLICKGIDAKYEILDAHIIITGKGCK